MSLRNLLVELAKAFDGPEGIESVAKRALGDAVHDGYEQFEAVPWAPPQTSSDAEYDLQATRTGDRALMSVYAWSGDISTENFVYDGIPSG